MTKEVKYYIEQNKSKIENNDLYLVYFNCPLYMLKELVEVLNIAGITCPPQIHDYVTVCCYMIDLLSKNVDITNIYHDTEWTEYVFTTATFKLIQCEQIKYDLLNMIKNYVDVKLDIDYSGYETITIRIRNS